MQQSAPLERFIGGLTMALGVGAMIPRPGLGLYALLESEGVRAIYSILLINFGCLLIACSYLPMPRLRVVMHFAACLLWAGLLYKFVTAALWGAALQACVVILFSIGSAVRLAKIHGPTTQETNGAK